MLARYCLGEVRGSKGSGKALSALLGGKGESEDLLCEAWQDLRGRLQQGSGGLARGRAELAKLELLRLETEAEAFLSECMAKRH